jgi:hypothetical protein
MFEWFDRMMVSLPVQETLGRLLHTLPGDDVKLDFDFVWLERYAPILYPVLAIGTLGLLALGIITAWRSDEISGVVKVEYKREIITLLRREVGGLPVERIARHLKLNVKQTARLIEEMKTDGMLEPLQRKTGTLWRIRGLSTQ